MATFIKGDGAVAPFPQLRANVKWDVCCSLLNSLVILSGSRH